MFKVRLATPKEIEGIKDEANLTPISYVAVAEDEKGDMANYAVVRQVVEVDPMYRASDGKAWRAFVWSIENHLRLQGVQEFYFNVAVEEEEWVKHLEREAERLSKSPEYRYKRVL